MQHSNSSPKPSAFLFADLLNQDSSPNNSKTSTSSTTTPSSHMTASQELHGVATPHNEEDTRFLRMAREALVATQRSSVDPSINELLQRLSYASTPHGTPLIKQREPMATPGSRAYFDDFPNFSLDIFNQQNSTVRVREDPTSIADSDPRSTVRLRRDSITENHPSNANNADWNFLIDSNKLQTHHQHHHHHGSSPGPYGASRHSPLNNNNLLSTSQQRNERRDSLPENNVDIYSLSSSSLATLNSQLSTTGSDSDPKPFICSECLLSFRRSSDLRRHQKAHLTILPNICPKCGKGFARKDALKRHIGTLTCKRNLEKAMHLNNVQYGGSSEDQDEQMGY